MGLEILLFLVLLICLVMSYAPIGVTGANSMIVGKITDLLSRWKKTPLQQWGKEFKDIIKTLNKNQFTKWKTRGMLSQKKLSADVSRGRMKLENLLHQSGLKPAGAVLSLCCGRGGWEQVYTPNELVTRVTAVTYGKTKETPGHEEFSDKPWKGKEKIGLINMDARKVHEVMDTKEYDWVMFDGGESYPDYEKEKERFRDLFVKAVMPAIGQHTKGYVLKILTPYDPIIIDCLKTIQKITKLGNLYHCIHSRNANMELYFLSTKYPGSLDTQARQLLQNRFVLSLEDVKFPRAYYNRSFGEDMRTPLTPGDEDIIEPPNMTDSIQQLGSPVSEPSRMFAHWLSYGIYPFGTVGSSASQRNKTAWALISNLIPSLSNFLEWTATNTTVTGFMRVFYRKVDAEPKENSIYHHRMHLVYKGLSHYFRSVGYVHTLLTDDEILERANRQGVGTPIDTEANVGDFLNTNWKTRLKELQKLLISGKFLYSIFFTMGKREKKKKGESGSRMIAYLPIPMRMLELKVFGRLLDITKPNINRFGVGGMALYDLGMRIDEVFKERAISDDIAGFDTKIGLRVLTNERDFIKSLCICKGKNKVCTQCNLVNRLYQVYGHPHILIPYDSTIYVRSELLKGRGQRMSGTAPTYSMNTITRLNIAILQMAEVDGIKDDELIKYVDNLMRDDSTWAGCGSGDDFFITSDKERIHKLSKTWDVLNELGFPRKDMLKNVDSHVCYQKEDVEFCSHHYEPVTYYDEITCQIATRYQPTRDLSEIVAKASMWIGGPDDGLDAVAWISAQGNNLIVNYSHMRIARRLGAAYKALSPPNLVLTEHGGRFLKRPWITNGDLLDIINGCLFGEGTQYPVPGFSVRKFAHLGYLGWDREKVYEPNIDNREVRRWKENLSKVVRKLSNKLGGDHNVYFDIYQNEGYSGF
uniref:NS5 n=1 Tax=Arachnidan jingmen-related virus TaxID=2822572 RepID=A0A8A6RPE4_9FLAV|nr:NS5 [Arachnidan jingmen-related virus]